LRLRRPGNELPGPPRLGTRINTFFGVNYFDPPPETKQFQTLSYIAIGSTKETMRSWRGIPLQRDEEAIFFNFNGLLRFVRDEPRHGLIVSLLLG